MEKGIKIENQDKREAKLELAASESLRGGVYANASFAKTTPKESTLDFVLIDSEEDREGELVVGGVLQARIIMTNDSLIELRDMLNSHIENNLKRVN